MAEWLLEVEDKTKKIQLQYSSKLISLFKYQSKGYYTPSL